MAEVSFDDVSKVYADGTRAVDGMSLAVEDGEFMVLVGPSGCGKTTALRMVAGLEDISAGVVRIGGQVVNHVPSRDRDIAMVFQSYALYPHLKVYDNIAFGLQLAETSQGPDRPSRARGRRILGLEEYLDRKPRALSGGQRQRVAMGRAIVREPRAFLMDEPLSNLDAKLRVQMRAEISRLQGDLGTTTLYVTHDQVEAMTMGHRVAVMRKGRLQQVAEPQELYDHPVNLFVGGFIGSPTMNMVVVTLERDGRDLVAVGGQPEAGPERPRPAPRTRRSGPTPASRSCSASGPRTSKTRPSSRACRPGIVFAAGSCCGNRWAQRSIIHFLVDAPAALTEDTRELARDIHGTEGFHPLGGGRDHEESKLVGRFSPQSRVREGQTIEAAVDVEALHFFDKDTGLGIYEAAEAERGVVAA